MGSPKALLDLGGEPILRRLTRVYERHCRQVVVVIGFEADRIRAAVRANYAVNPDPSRGQLSSLQCGLAALRDDGPFLFQPVDYAAVSEATIRTLLAVMEIEEPLLAIPRFDGKRGHPVACAAKLRAEFLALSPDAAARDIIHARIAETRYVDVQDREILRDIDSPEDYKRLMSEVEPVR